ncbi:MAG: DUF2625 domain-containing protein [Deferribacteraceae bacterium]|nr:DUF2625 domain-containing protein [Deferribacteraceae bacterium]
MKSLDELLKGPSSWPIIEEIMSRATNSFELLPKTAEAADLALMGLQQSVKSLMGAITYETGGIMIDGGWLRILGSGHERLTRNITNWNLGRSHETAEDTPGFLMVADDAMGGIFAVNGTELGDDTGSMYYLAPDTAEWEPMEVSYHEFLEFCFVGQVDKFYENLRWDGWQEAVALLHGDQAFMVFPPLWAEGPDNLAERELTPAPMDEVYDTLLEINNMLFDDSEDGHSCGCGDDDCDCEDGDNDGCDCGCDHK